MKKFIFAMVLFLFSSGAALAQVNDYCHSGEIPTYIKWNIPKVYDGPAELPERCVATHPWNMPSPGPTVDVAAGQDLQAAYNAAACGTILSLAHGNTWIGPYNFTAKGCDDAHWITIMSDGTLGYPGTRMIPANEPQLAAIVEQGSQSTTVGDHIRFLGIEWAQAPGTGVSYGLVGTSGADHVVFERNYCHGNVAQEAQRCIQLNTGKYVAVIDSWLSEFHCIAVTGACSDAQAIGGGTGAVGDLISHSGPFKILNNHLEGSGENMMFGGGTADGCPKDITILHNDFIKPLSWNPSDPTYDAGGMTYIVKNLFELKNACRVLAEGNIFENNWGGFSQRGYAILFTPKNQSGANGTNLCPNCTVSDVTFRYNYITTAAGAFLTSSGASDNGGWSKGQRRTSIHDNVADNLQYSDCYGCGYSLFELGSGYSATNPPPPSEVLFDVLIQNNDIIAVGDLSPANITSQLLNVGGPPLNALGIPRIRNVGFLNNVAATQKSGMYSTGGETNCMSFAPTPITPARDWATCFVGKSPFTGNILVGYAKPQTDWPAGNQFSPDFTSLFVNYNGGLGGDYHLIPGTTYTGGANIDLVSQYTAGVR